MVLALDAVETTIDQMGGGKYNPKDGFYSAYIADLFKRRTGRELEVREIIATAGQTTTIDMVLASGERLDVITGYAGRMSKWAVPAWALPLDDYIPREDLAQWIDGALDPYYRAGKLYALPIKAWQQTILVNLDMAQKVGMLDKVPPAGGSWALSDFMEMAKRVKAQGLGYAIVLWATMPSGDYWQQLWLTGFGAQLWKDGKVALDTPEGREAVAWLASMQQYAPPGPAGLDYNAMLKEWKDGRLLAAGGNPGGWTDAFAWRMVLPPSVPGKKGKVIQGPDSVLVFKTAKEKQIAVELARVIAGKEAQGMWVSACSAYPTMKGVADPVAWMKGEGKDAVGVSQFVLDRWKIAAVMARDAGVWDAGIPNSAYSKVRELWLVCLQTVFLSKSTVPEAVAKFQKDANAFIEAQ